MFSVVTLMVGTVASLLVILTLALPPLTKSIFSEPISTYVSSPVPIVIDGICGLILMYRLTSFVFSCVSAIRSLCVWKVCRILSPVYPPIDADPPRLISPVIRSHQFDPVISEIMPTLMMLAFKMPIVIMLALICPSCVSAMSSKGPLYPLWECPKPPIFQRQTLTAVPTSSVSITRISSGCRSAFSLYTTCPPRPPVIFAVFAAIASAIMSKLGYVALNDSSTCALIVSAKLVFAFPSSMLSYLSSSTFHSVLMHFSVALTLSTGL